MPRIVRKYGNRRLYDTQDSCYINLAELAALIKAGEEVVVEDASTKADLTRELYFQVLFEHEGAMDFLPLGMLRRIIRATGEDPAQKVLRGQLGQAFHLLSDQMDRLEQTFGAFTPKPPAPKRTKAIVAASMLEGLDRFARDGYAPFAQQWQELDALLGQPVRILQGDRAVEGVARGTDASGALRVECDGRSERFFSGEVSLRPSWPGAAA